MKRPSLMACWKAHGQLSIHINELSSPSIMVPEFMRRNVYSLAVFTGGQLLCIQILPGRGRPTSTTLGNRKPETSTPVIPAGAYPHMQVPLSCIAGGD